MLPRALPALLAVCLIPLACTVTTTQVDGNEPKPSSSADTKVADPAEPDPANDDDDSKPNRVAPPTSELPDCPSGGSLPSYCTDEGKLAGQWILVDTLKIPDDVEIIFNAENADASNQTSLLIAIRGEELYIKHVTCGACRRVLGQAFTGQLAHMSETQVRGMQTQLGLADDTPLLASADAWQSFCIDDAGKAALAQLAEKSEGDGR